MRKLNSLFKLIKYQIQKQVYNTDNKVLIKKINK